MQQFRSVFNAAKSASLRAGKRSVLIYSTASLQTASTAH